MAPPDAIPQGTGRRHGAAKRRRTPPSQPIQRQRRLQPRHLGLEGRQALAVLLHHLLRRAARRNRRCPASSPPCALSASALSRSLRQPRALGGQVDRAGQRQHHGRLVQHRLRRALRHLAVQRAARPEPRASRRIALDPALATRQRLRRGVAQQDRRHRARRHVHFRAHRADRADQPHHPVEFGARRRRVRHRARHRARARGSGCTARRSRSGPTAPR